LNEGLEGNIEVSLTLTGEGRIGVEIRSSRPQVAQRLMAGRTAEGAAEVAGLVFSLCGRAQRVAAEAACAAAQGRPVGAGERQGQAARVLQELAQEHAWRLFLDWPGRQGQVPDVANLLRLRQAAGDQDRFATVLADLVETALLGEPVETWLGRDLAGLDAWRRAGRTTAARLFASLGGGMDLGVSRAPLLPSLADLTDTEPTDLGRRALAEPGFCAQPLWEGGPAETGSLARVGAQPILAAWLGAPDGGHGRGRGAGARLLARLVELALLPRWLGAGGPEVVRAWRLGDNTGVAGVETSRGLLLHAVRLEAGLVVDYRILAPTEWNFHPQGPLAEGLEVLGLGSDPESDQDLYAQARLIAQSLDPCVTLSLALTHA
jgi:uptake hydrogenase large subunit